MKLNKSTPILVKTVTSKSSMENLEILERLCVQAIRKGVGTPLCVKVLQDIFNILYVAHAIEKKPDSDLMLFLNNGLAKVHSDGTHYFIYQQDEQWLISLVNYNRNYWLTKSTSFFAKCVGELRSFYKKDQSK